MKKHTLIILTIVILLCTIMCACNTSKNEETMAATIHTMPPTTSPYTEPEWCEIDCEISLVDEESNEIISKNDFETFALWGNDDDTGYITIKLSDTGTQIIKSLDKPTEMSLVVNNTILTKVQFDPATFNGEFEFGKGTDFETLCQYANTIRGLF